MHLDDLNGLDEAAATRAFLRCCGSRRWATRMAVLRPFDDARTMADGAERAFETLDRADWLEAFAAHPKIGADQAGGASRAGAWSAQEQALVAEGADKTLQRLAEANRDYEARFGYIFIVCATGKTAAEMLALLERRLQHDPGAELGIAADEQRRITRLRLSKLLADEQDNTR
jgi:2-oxo-4-hydroxy-4-carboxy-5-ureidoimidazoline decarboxylase